MATVVLNRKPVNSFSLEFLEEINTTFSDLENNRDIRGMILTSVSTVLYLFVYYCMLNGGVPKYCLSTFWDKSTLSPLKPSLFSNVINTFPIISIVFFFWQSLPKVFSAGLDLIKEVHNPDPKRLAVFWRGFQEMWLQLYGSRLATIAVINVRLILFILGQVMIHCLPLLW